VAVRLDRPNRCHATIGDCAISPLARPSAPGRTDVDPGIVVRERDRECRVGGIEERIECVTVEVVVKRVEIGLIAAGRLRDRLYDRRARVVILGPVRPVGFSGMIRSVCSVLHKAA